MCASIREHYFDSHYRVVVVEGGGERLYSIDVYERLEGAPENCRGWLESGGPSKLCYLPLNPSCEAVVVVSPKRVEVVNLRFKSRISEDPFNGDAGAAREHCLETLRRLLHAEGGQAGRVD